MKGSYEIREHTADVAVAARGNDLAAVFAAVADGLAAASCERWPSDGETFDVTVSAESQEALLFDYLDELIYQRDVRNVLPVDNDVTIRYDGTQWSILGTTRGVPTDLIDAREVKAVTYSEMALEETESGWEAYVVFDV